jgi:hypothetical protein
VTVLLERHDPLADVFGYDLEVTALPDGTAEWITGKR